MVANIAGMTLINKENSKKVARHNDENNLMYSVCMGKKDVEISDSINNSYLVCLTGSMTIHMPKKPMHKDVYIDLTSVFGNVTINLPVGVKTEYDGWGQMEMIQDVLPHYEEEEDMPTVHITRRAIASKILLRCMTSWQEHA